MIFKAERTLLSHLIKLFHFTGKKLQPWGTDILGKGHKDRPGQERDGSFSQLYVAFTTPRAMRRNKHSTKTTKEEDRLTVRSRKHSELGGFPEEVASEI